MRDLFTDRLENGAALFAVRQFQVETNPLVVENRVPRDEDHHRGPRVLLQVSEGAVLSGAEPKVFPFEEHGPEDRTVRRAITIATAQGDDPVRVGD